MSIGTQAGADWRVLMSAALIGSGVGLSLGAAYLAGGMAQHAADHSRVARIAQAAAEGYAGEPVDLTAPVVVASDLFALAVNTDTTDRLKDPKADAAARRARELECLTQAVYYEARGEGVRGQQAVAQVVMNRVKHPAFPSTICGVVFQGAGGRGCQFSFACDGSMRRGREHSAWTRANRIAARALSGAALAEVGSATHFHTTAVSPAWGPQMRQVAQVGMHVFYKFNPRKPSQPRSAPEMVEQAVMTSVTGGPPVELRLTSALAEKPGDPVAPTPPAALDAAAAAVKAAPLAVKAPPLVGPPAIRPVQAAVKPAERPVQGAVRPAEKPAQGAEAPKGAEATSSADA